MPTKREIKEFHEAILNATNLLFNNGFINLYQYNGIHDKIKQEFESKES